MTVAEYIASFLASNNVRHVFGMQGGAILKIVDEIVLTGKIEYIANFHEQASAFCADSYSRIGQNLGVALATSGPGATNLVTGIANAQLDSIPTLFITGQEYSTRIAKSSQIRSNGFQDLDIVSIVSPITKYAKTVLRAEDIAYELEAAVHFAKSGRPGAVLLDIPIDVQFLEVNPSELVHFTADKEYQMSTNSSKTPKVIQLLKESKRPVILAGGGVSLAGARDEFQQFATATNIPVALTLNGLDLTENSLGFSGLYGNPAANLSIYNADLLLVLGSRLGQHQVGKSKKEYTRGRIVHVDIDNNELGRCVEEELSICVELKSFLKTLNENIKNEVLPNYRAWIDKTNNWKQKYVTIKENSIQFGVSPLELVQKIQDCLPCNSVIASDVGQNQMWVAQAIRVKKGQRILNSSGLGSMGYALPASIAAKIHSPESSVVAFMGDGGVQINLQELELLKLKQLNIKVVVFRNERLGLIKNTQDKYYGERNIGCAPPEFGCPNLYFIAKAYDIKYLLIKTDEDLKQIKTIFYENYSYIIEVLVDPEFPLKTRYDLNDVMQIESIDE